MTVTNTAQKIQTEIDPFIAAAERVRSAATLLRLARKGNDIGLIAKLAETHDQSLAAFAALAEAVQPE